VVRRWITNTHTNLALLIKLVPLSRLSRIRYTGLNFEEKSRNMEETFLFSSFALVGTSVGHNLWFLFQ
jgi:hypothetical protein